MKCARTCSDCNRAFKIEYDENNGTLAFCPFCGVEAEGTDWDEDDAIELGEVSQGSWGDEFENF